MIKIGNFIGIIALFYSCGFWFAHALIPSMFSLISMLICFSISILLFWMTNYE